jgi:radical SAM protein with 4Fe4S-binding SPASM domain
MRYQPLTAVWEVTMGCNMRCGHCGSSCAEPLPDELDTEQALELCDQIAGLGLRWITLSGGEPLTRKDLPLLVRRLRRQGVTVNIITNGWLMDARRVAELKDAGASTVAVSLDGTEEVHDAIRRAGSYRQAEAAFKLLGAQGVRTGAVTTVTKRNLNNLPALREELLRMGVKTWQVQIGLPMGNLKERPDWLIAPGDVAKLLDFCHETALQGQIRVFPADCVGYNTKKELEIRQIAFRQGRVPLWDGCNAGVRSFGILHNGDILGCTSIRDRAYIEGNVLTRRLRDIWEDPGAFAWRRGMTKADLGGECAACVYGGKCLGGCPNTRLTMNGTLQSENQYCAYALALKAFRERLSAEADAPPLVERAERKLREGAFQEAALLLGRALELSPDHPVALDMLGFAEFMCGNYARSQAANERALELNPQNAYAVKGLGLCLHRRGQGAEGLAYLEKAAQMTGYADPDILHDLAVVRAGR